MFLLTHKITIKFINVLLAILLTLTFVGFVFANTSQTNTSKKSVKPVHFVSLADIHFDPFAACHNMTSCPLIKKLQQAPVDQWAKLLAIYDVGQPQYKKDTSYPLLVSALTAAKNKADNDHAQFVLVLGDFLAHDFRDFYKKYTKDKTSSGYQSFVHKTMAFLTKQLVQTFPSIDIYAVVGNNDSYQGDYVSRPQGQFFKETAVLWSSLIKNKVNRVIMQKQFPVAGYYAVNISSEPSLRLLVLNSNLFSINAHGKSVEQAANEELDWLHNQLQIAKEKHQRVFIAMHIPVGIDVYASLRFRLFRLVELWQANYAQRFQADLQEFAPNIAAIFAAHLHSDWFQILTFDHSNEIPVTGTPSVSPIFGNNPGFKIYTYSPKTLQIEDFVTYYYPLNSKKGWDMEYDFNHIYQPDCDNCPITKGMDLINQVGILANHYKIFYAVSSTSSESITTRWYPFYWCAIWKIDPEEYKACLEHAKAN